MVQVNDSLYLVESVVRLGKLGLQQALAERQHGCLLLRLGDAQVGNVAAAVKQRLRERPYRTKQPVARIDDCRAAVVGPPCRTAKRYARVECRTRCIRVVERLCQRSLGLAHVGSAVEQLQRHSHGKLLGELLPVERSMCPDIRPNNADSEFSCALICFFSVNTDASTDSLLVRA